MISILAVIVDSRSPICEAQTNLTHHAGVEHLFTALALCDFVPHTVKMSSLTG
jgi:hypothetical protein